ncbi:MAG: YgaP family membrane protein [Bacillota bacterium]
MKNEGTIDRLIRVLVGIGLLVFFFLGEGSTKYFGLIGVALLMAFFLEGSVRNIYLIGLIPLATAVINWCPIYSLLGIKTCECKKC